jgi:drug/metabolite transporter (DMT)-like permease
MGSYRRYWSLYFLKYTWQVDLKILFFNNLMRIIRDFIRDFISRNSTLFLIIGMLLTGSLNTILTKLQDSVCVDKCDTDSPVYFEQPMIQTLNMFLGEIMCLIWLLFYRNNHEYILVQSDIDGNIQDNIDGNIQDNIDGNIQDNIDGNIQDNIDGNIQDNIERKSYTSSLLLFFPAACDCMSSTLMNIGLMFTSASIFQMLRGSIVIFTGIISTIFLGVRYNLNQWLSLIVIFLGIGVVGISNITSDKNTLVGIILIISAQILSASQYVIEEKIMIRYNVEPLLAVGLEGIFGLVIMTIISSIFQITRVIDTLSGLKQLIIHPLLYWPSLGIVFSISLFNWFGLCITRNISSTSRATIDICRTLIIWCVSLSLQWETFKWLQIVGFCVMICGILIFNKKEFSTN